MFAALVCHLRGVLTRRRAEHELDEELRFHVEMETQANMGRGLNEIEARRVALRDMGGVTQTKEAVHDLRGALVVERVFQDAKGALRRARREPGFAAAVIVTCGLAIGLATTIYAMAAGVLLHPLPFEKPEQLVQLWKTAPEWDRVAVSVPEFFEWNGEAYSFVALNAARDVAFRLVTSDGAKWAQGLSVTPGMFTMLGVRAQIGRTFLPAEDQPGHNRVVMLDEGFWRRAFAANPKVVGTRIRLLTDDSRFPGAEPFEVIGIVPSSVRLRYRNPSRCDLYVPLAPLPVERQAQARNGAALWIFGRLRPGVTISQAQAEVQTIFSRRSADFIRSLPGASVRVTPLHEEMLGHTRSALLLLGGAVVVVLLIAGANIVNLLLASGLRRSEELRARVALGCSRGRLVQQLVTESLVLAVGGGLLGGIVAVAAIPLAVHFAPATLPRLDQVRFDGGAAAVAVTLSCVGGLLLSLLPALLSTHPASLGPLRPRAVTWRERFRFKSVLIVAETAMVVMLLSASGLVANSLWRMSHVQLGFEPHNVLTFRVVLPREYSRPGRRQAFQLAMLSKLQSRHGIIDASWTTELPFSEGGLMGYEVRDGGEHNALVTAATPNYLKTLAVPLVAGRMLTAADENDPRVAVVNQQLARRVFPGGNAIGQRVGFREWYEIVGIVGDITEIATIRGGVRQKGLDRVTLPQIYIPSTAPIGGWPYLVLRIDDRVHDLLPATLADLRSVAPDVPVLETSTLDERVASAAVDTRFYAAIVGSFAAVSFALACVGLFGMLAYTVARRTHEFGVRFAVGASANQVERLVLRQAATLTIVGAAIGLAVAVSAGKLLEGFLFELSPSDPWTLFLAVAVLVAGSLATAYLPARRASRIDPMTALRCE
jgi:putative ABC transport system permease protein